MTGQLLAITVATSAPVNVPDWSKIQRVESIELMHDSDERDLQPEWFGDDPTVV